MVSAGTESYRLKLLGGWDLRGPDDTVVRSLLAQPKRLCLLAYLALSGEPVGRAKIVALFWPESDEERARNSLNQAVHYLRRSLSKDAVQTVEGDRLWVPTDIVWFDARGLLESGSAGGDTVPGDGSIHADDATEFFDGWNADDSQPLQEWLDGVRARVRQRLVDDRRSHMEAGSGPESPATALPVHAGRRSAEGLRRAAGGGRLLGAAAVALVALAVVLNSSEARNDVNRLASGPEEVAVLLPSVFTSGDVPVVSAEHILDELVAGLARSGGARIRTLRTIRSVAELKESLEALGAEDRPDWAVTLSVRVVDGHARVIGMLLRGPDYSETLASPGWDYPVDTDDQALVDLPRQIAADATVSFAEWIGEGRAR